MGLISRIIDTFPGKFGELLAKVAIFKNDNLDARIFNPPGVDARPLDSDIGFSEDSEDTEGGKDILGFIDPKNASIAEKGEHRLYSRDDSGTIVAIVYVKKTGEITVTGGPGQAIIFDILKHKHLDSWGRPTSEPLIDGAPVPSPPTTVIIESNIDTATNSKKIDGKQFLDHKHSQGQDSNGDDEVDTNGVI